MDSSKRFPPEPPDWFPAFVAGLLVGATVLSFIAVGFGARTTPGEGAAMTYTNMAATMLGAVAVLVTVLGVFIAVLAFWGYSQFRGVAKKSALKFMRQQMAVGGNLRVELEGLLVSEVIRKLDQPEGPLRDVLVQRVDEIIQTDAERRAANSGGDRLADEEKEYGE